MHGPCHRLSCGMLKSQRFSPKGRGLFSLENFRNRARFRLFAETVIWLSNAAGKVAPKDYQGINRGLIMTDMTMNQATLQGGQSPQTAGRPNLDGGFNPLTAIIFFGVVAAGLLFVSYSIYEDV